MQEASTPTVLFLTRKWQGKGGMQQLSQDLFAALKHQNISVRLCAPPVAGMLGQILFAIKAMGMVVWFGGRGERVLLGDCALGFFGLLTRVCGGTYVMVACGLDVILENRIYQWYVRRGLRYAQCIIAISQATAEEVEKRGVLSSRICILPCGIWPSQRVPEKLTSDIRILILGRLIPRKGALWFTENVISQVLQHHPTAQFRIVGSGPEAERVRECVLRKNLISVTLTGEVSSAQKEEELSRASLLVYPNRKIHGDMEGFGISCIEASARGIPVVASNIEGLRDAVIPGKTGLFFAEGDSSACADAVHQLLTQPLHPESVRTETEARYSWLVLGPQYARAILS